MKCCKDCFSSNYLKTIITSNSAERGNCSFCKTKDTILYDPTGLLEFFRNLLHIYKPLSNESSDNIYSNIEDSVQKDFPAPIFQIRNPDKIKQLLLTIVKDEIDDFKDLFNNTVYIECIHNPFNIEQTSLLELSWDRFVQEIKTENRFHIRNAEYLKKLEKLFKRHEKLISQNKIFYRARISDDENGFDPHNMGVPPHNSTKAGRANPQGIAYLYLSNDIDTTIYETRATIFDYVSIGEFKLLEDINVINLREVDIYDPIELAEDDTLEDFLIHLPFISRLEKELSKPHRRSDNDLDYLPTQYLCEYIKSLGYDGLEYKSSINPRIGANLAIFNPTKFECTNVTVYEIHNIAFEKTIKNQTS